MCYVSIAFLRVVPQSQSYMSVPTGEERRSSNPLRRTKSEDRKHSVRRHDQEPGTRPHDPHISVSSHQKSDGSSETVGTLQASDEEPDETSSLISSSPGDVLYERDGPKAAAHHDSQHLDIRGFVLLKHTEFYQLWLMLGICTGIGLMTIK